jgi:dihydrofolate reductase
MSAKRTAQPEQGAGNLREVVLSVAMSLDGYIARRDGSVDWLIMDPKLDLGAFMRSVDVILAGRRTLEPAVGSGGGHKSLGMAAYVFSRSKEPGKRDGVEYVNRAPGELVRELKGKPGRDIWLMGGGELARDFLRDDLVDRMELGIMPILLGDGIPLFPRGFPERRFELRNAESYPSGIVMLKYARMVK